MPDIVDDIQAAWELHADRLADLPNVVTVEMGYRTRDGKPTRTPALVVGVRRKLPPELLGPSSMCPREVRLPNGKAIDVDVIEVPLEYTREVADRATYRPVPGGCEIGPFGSGIVGTLGGWFCRPRRDGLGFRVVWLTNAHIADPGNAARVPADARMTQPGGGDVIGRTTAVVGYPSPGPAAGVTVNGVCDAAIGRLDEGVSFTTRVLQMAPAPFETSQVRVGMALQKRGRTTRLTTGTVAGAEGMPPWITVNMASTNSAGFVRLGSPGNPRVYRVNSNAPGLAAAFTAPGDSGSLYFGQRAGHMSSTFPGVGLHFAGTYRAVSRLPDPSTATVTSLGFDLVGVMAQFNLRTVCNCVMRSLINAIYGSEREAGRETTTADSGIGMRTQMAETMMRGFRDDVLANSSIGKSIVEAVTQATPDVALILAEDPIAFGLAVDLLRPWATAATSLAVLNRELDGETVRLARELAGRITELSPHTKSTVSPMTSLLEKHAGRPVKELIGRVSVDSFRAPERTPARNARRATKKAD